MNENKRSHLWIPDEEVKQVPKVPTSRNTPRDVVFSEHGRKLSSSLQKIKQNLDETNKDNSLIDSDLVVFRVELSEGDAIQSKKKIFDANGMYINAVKNDRSAVVSTSKQQFQILKNKIEVYAQKGRGKTYFNDIDDFKPYSGIEKNSNELRKLIYIQKPPETIDVQLMLIPNLRSSVYSVAAEKITKKIVDNGGAIQEAAYYLSDNTPVIRAIIPSSSLSHYENDIAIYRIEETHFFSADLVETSTIPPSNFTLDSDIDYNLLPAVAILDSGVDFSKPLDSILISHWIPPSSTGGNSEHGTKVASRVAFNYLGESTTTKILQPRVRIIDCNILDGNVPENILITRIQQAVATHKEITKIFNLSINALTPIEGDEMSILGYELDMLQIKNNIQFIISAGNHRVWETETDLSNIIDDDDARISNPADSMLSIVVGSVVATEHKGSLSGKNIVAPYSRIGPGFAGFSKPDMSAYSGTVIVTSDGYYTPADDFSNVITKRNQIVPDAGTSFSAPIVAGDFAEILGIIPDENVLLAKALLYHNAKPLWEDDDMDEEELILAHNLYGKGLSSINDSKFSSPSRVTFVRTGTLNKETKERVTIFMPSILAAQAGRNVAKVTVTCISQPPVDRTKGNQYLGAYIRASLKKSHPLKEKLLSVQQEHREGRKKWDICHQFTKVFSQFHAGDWQVWLELFSRWDEKKVDVPYALVITIEDISGTLDVYSEIEALNRYRALNTIRLRIDA